MLIDYYLCFSNIVNFSGYFGRKRFSERQQTFSKATNSIIKKKKESIFYKNSRTSKIHESLFLQRERI